MSNPIKILQVVIFLTLVGASAQLWAQPTSPPAGETAKALAAPPAVPAHQDTAPIVIKGTVVETLSGGGYTFVCVENAGEKRWAAMPPADVKVGQEVEFGGVMEMSNFTSKSLGRTFEKILFCGGPLRPKEGAAAGASVHGNDPSPHHPETAAPMMSKDQGHGVVSPAEMAAARTQASSSRIAGKVVETFDGGGYTFAAVEKDGRRNWVAIPPNKLTVGEDVEFVPGFVMTNFTSKALGRTFETITFSGGVMKP